MRWAAFCSSRMCSPRAAASDSIREAAEALVAFQRMGGRKGGRECRRVLESGAEGVGTSLHV